MQITQLLSIIFCLNTMKKPGKRLQMNPVEASCEKSFTWMGFIAAPPLIVHVFIVIGFTSKQDIFTIYQSHVTITCVKSFHCPLLHFREFYDLIFFDDYSLYQQVGYKNPCFLRLFSVADPTNSAYTENCFIISIATSFSSHVFPSFHNFHSNNVLVVS